MASGVTVSDVCKTTYEEIKKDKKHRYVIFFIRDEKQIDVETVGDRNAEYDQFLEDIQKCGPGECRYGLFDFEYMHQCQGTSESSKKQKLFLMSWCPDTAKVKKKMLYSSSFDALKKSLVGVQKYIQATDLSEASREAVEEKLRATDRQYKNQRHRLLRRSFAPASGHINLQFKTNNGASSSPLQNAHVIDSNYPTYAMEGRNFRRGVFVFYLFQIRGCRIFFLHSRRRRATTGPVNLGVSISIPWGFQFERFLVRPLRLDSGRRSVFLATSSQVRGFLTSVLFESELI